MSDFFKSIQCIIAKNNMRKLLILQNCYFYELKFSLNNRVITYSYIPWSFNNFSIKSYCPIEEDLDISECKVVTKTFYTHEKRIYIITNIGRFKIPSEIINMLLDNIKDKPFEQYLDLCFPVTIELRDDSCETVQAYLKIYYGEKYV